MDWLSEWAFATRTFAQFRLDTLAYAEARARFGLSSQAVVRAIANVADAYQLDRKIKRTFRPTGGIAYDECILIWHEGAGLDLDNDGTSAQSLRGRARQSEFLRAQKGESDVMYRRGVFYLAAPATSRRSRCWSRPMFAAWTSA